ncbi:MAG: helix-turn-helix domain-containing protein, partial [Acidobacteriota bacterium]
MKKTAPRFTGVRVIHKAVDVLEKLGAAGGGLSLAGLAGAVDMPKPTVYRIAATLEARGYLGRTPEGHYRLSRRLADLRSGTATAQQLAAAARPEMVRLAASCKETLNLGVLDAGDVVV